MCGRPGGFLVCAKGSWVHSPWVWPEQDSQREPRAVSSAGAHGPRVAVGAVVPPLARRVGGSRGTWGEREPQVWTLVTAETVTGWGWPHT